MNASWSLSKVTTEENFDLFDNEGESLLGDSTGVCIVSLKRHLFIMDRVRTRACKLQALEVSLGRRCNFWFPARWATDHMIRMVPILTLQADRMSALALCAHVTGPVEKLPSL